MLGLLRSLGGFIGACLLLGLAGNALAQSEYPPPCGKGPVVVVVSGSLDAAHYEPPGKQIAGLGYDVVLLDGSDMASTLGRGAEGRGREGAICASRNTE